MKWLLLFLISIVSCTQKAYEGTGAGYNGQITVSVTLDEDKIRDIKVLSHEDTDYIADRSFPLLKQKAINANCAIIDSVSGATYSSFGYKMALANALKKSGRDIPQITLNTATPMTLEIINGEDLTIDVVVIGGGPAGLMSAVQAQKKGASVILLEKLDIIGGNGMHAEVLYGIPNTKAQQEKGISDSEELFYQALKANNPLETDNRLKAHAHVASRTDEWLRENDIEMNYAVESGDPMYRMVMLEHSAKGYAGKRIVLGLEQKAKELGVDIRTGAQVNQILISNKQAIGVSIAQGSTNYNVYAKSVIVATGGFSANIDLVHQYNPKTSKINFTSNSKGAVGDLIPVFKDLDIALRNMGVLNIHPVIETTTRMPGGGFNPITEFMLINKQGQRFINEVNTRDALSFAIADQTDATVYFVFDEASRELWAVPSLEGIFKNHVIVADTPEALAKKMRLDSNAFVKTLETFNQVARGEIKDPYNRTAFHRPKVKSPYYALRITSGFHMTRGGIVTDEETRVLNTSGQIIKGLYGAGEVTDITSGALTSAVGFGYLAGENAATFALQ